MRWTPTPLVCALVLAAGIAIHGGSHPTEAPAGGRVVGEVHGPVVRGPYGWGARVGDDVWVWAGVPLAPGERIAANGKLHAPRGLLDPGVPDRTALVASRGAHWELAATSIERLADDPDLISRAWRKAAEIQASWAARIDEPACR
jgi:hypothetical protein